MSIATLTSKGQVTIPKEIRDKLSLRAGDRITFTPTQDGVLIRAQKVPFETLRGVLGRPPVGGLSVEEMDEGVAAHLRRKHGKS